MKTLVRSQKEWLTEDYGVSFEVTEAAGGLQFDTRKGTSYFQSDGELHAAINALLAAGDQAARKTIRDNMLGSYVYTLFRAVKR